MKRIIFLLIILYLIGCTESSNKKDNQRKRISSNDTAKSIIGKWGGLNEEQPVFEIRKDSIYYYQTDKIFSYTMIGKDLVIDFIESKGVLKKIHREADTLIFEDSNGGVIKGYKFPSGAGE